LRYALPYLPQAIRRTGLVSGSSQAFKDVRFPSAPIVAAAKQNVASKHVRWGSVMHTAAARLIHTASAVRLA